MTAKHARLASAVADAMLAQGFTTKQVATFGGCSPSVISNALSGKYDMREERWRLVCENLGLDYDEIIKDPEQEEIHVEETARSAENEESPAEEIRGGTVVPVTCIHVGDLAVAARYMAGHLKEDIRKGMDISLEDLYTLMTFCKRMQEAAENGT